MVLSDYTYDALRRATNNFRSPAVVRGLFNGTRATSLWNSRDYLPKAFGDVSIPVVRDGRVGTLQDDRVVVRETQVAYNRRTDIHNDCCRKRLNPLLKKSTTRNTPRNICFSP